MGRDRLLKAGDEMDSTGYCVDEGSREEAYMVKETEKKKGKCGANYNRLIKASARR
jgi:hypothetical protein